MSTSSTQPAATEPRRRLRLPSFSVQILLGLALGVLLGWLALSIGKTPAGEENGLTVALSTIGGSFVSLLKAVVPPLVFTAIVASIANLRGVANAARLAGQTLLWFAITALIAVGIGIGLGLLLQPGRTAGVDESEAGAPSTTGTWLDFLQGLVPQNFLGLGASSSLETADDGTITAVSTGLSFNVLQIIVIALVVGIAALKTGTKAEPFLTLNRSVLTVVQKVLWWIIRLAPLGTLGLIGRAIATYGWTSLASLGTFAIAVYLGLALVLLVVYPVLLKSHGLSVGRYFRGAWPAIQLGFVSRSSIGTLPVTERVTHRNLGVPRAYASFAVPLGSTTKMDGCAAIYPAVAAIFVAQFFGIDLSVLDYLLIAFVSVVGSAATAGLTGAVVMLTLTLSTLGLPLEGVGLLLAIDPILDMGRTAVNVAGQVLVPVIVAKRERILDVEQYNAADAEDLFADDDDEVPAPAAEETDGVASAGDDAATVVTGTATPEPAGRR
ncbi:dicarboxylate/amino acid:cation symporter [Georgenia sp. TF02-10]|uniref:dicarboxylate/amino acid:cation symporter n=1 Tax=Georgenia sp. TF02-10 TaxID=2917725 RepID=UPI001FA6FE64|nr:dicarboxylate/amino acid:cation symporter [Georgenia sp. TF02-10]UNX55418.1 dicarboxylate/amino acid:cation symporter [Georgenia sp. TF02-10]